MVTVWEMFASRNCFTARCTDRCQVVQQFRCISVVYDNTESSHLSPITPKYPHLGNLVSSERRSNRMHL